MKKQETLKPYSPVKADVQLPKLEEEILDFWNKNKIFEKSIQKGSTEKFFSFYDGPPFATGLPHYGHLLAGTLKDIVPRYWTMKGYSIPRRFGWDCHGLPVEYEINKTHKIENRKQILEMGVSTYNSMCRSIVTRYAGEWKKSVHRMGRWVDMDHAYYTMDVGFMQSVWWVFQSLFEKGLIYEGYKVVPYSVGISTPLSNFEANQNYKMTQDPALTVAFPLLNEKNTSVLAWTTTPWTLPSNLALAVGKEIEYVKIKDLQKNQFYILAQSLYKTVFKDFDKNFELIETFPGSTLLQKEYEPLFPFFQDLKTKGAFKIIHSDHVTTDSGTGIVHMAPAFGEDDYNACKKENIPLVNPVDDDGVFTAEVPPYAGKKAKDADKDIIADIKKSGRLIKHDTITHSYPFCYRSDTPLIYRAVSSWFVKVEAIKEKVLSANQTTNWIPEHLRDGRFGNWLENARDWAISRNRFWGTPLPIWKNTEGEIICVGSKSELEKLSGKTVKDLHMEFIDSIEIPSPTGKSPLKRVEGVLDCWFESGSMPYAQWNYPFENKEAFEKSFPADFIAEGLDQTRGWFYTLMVIGAALKNQAPFKNVVVNGLILAEDGKKMSKSLKNYPDPMDVLNLHGADSLRLYLIDSPVVKAQELRFSEAGVKDIVRRILLRWWNAYSFFVSYANIDDFIPKGDAHLSPNLLDQWVLSRLHSLIQYTEEEMNAYRLYNVVPGLLKFIEDLTNTYIRFNRRHFWRDGMPEDKRFAYETLHEVLITLSKVMAPFAPFLSEVTYQNLSQVLKNKKESVHLDSFPVANKKMIRPDLNEAVQCMDTLMMLGRNHREKINVKAKIPLLELKIIHREPQVLENLKKFEPYFKDELNFRKIHYHSNEDDFIQVTAKAHFPSLGKRLGPKMKLVAQKIQALELKEILTLEANEKLLIEGESIELSDVEIRRAPKDGNANLTVHQHLSIEVDPTVNEDQVEEGFAREIIRKIQQARKNADFNLDDRIHLEVQCDGPLKIAFEKHKNFIMSETLCQTATITAQPSGTHTEKTVIESNTDTSELMILIGIKVENQVSK